MKQKRVLQIVACLVSLALFSCRSTRTITRATFPSDTTAVSTDSLSGEKESALARSILEKVNANRMEFRTFTAELKMDYEDDKGKKMNNLGVNIRMMYDSVIWVRVSGPLNVEGARVLITKDSIKIVNRLEGTVTLRSTSEAQELLKLGTDFKTLQDLIVGNPVFLSDSISNIVTTQSVISFASVQEDVTSLFNVFADDYVLQQCKITEKDDDSDTPRTGELTYGDHKTVNGRKFAFQRRIYAEDKSVVKVALDFKKVEFDNEQTFPFPIPARYTRE
ncbi:DUF4292 domain-containing protein [Chitinophaga sp. XS-30]|uniref:DUF4292 domain-containing protein n=1 Tax=Chitinophaga sp. XS-30 TaxID=2604421 RepID=UPI0011DD0414|nr:DUF4292 domain-containing protein [Chitinophaga sp. XS-30]QEH40670.1 DUF4292 domain-containing protein [Chitinophaga sp. XS-30]